MLPPTDQIEITCAELDALRKSGAAFRLIDCREQDEWDICHIEGAELSPLTTFAEDAPKRFTDPAEALVIHCHHGVRSGKATQFLRQRGLPKVWSLAGGIEQWAAEIDPAMPRY